MNNPAPLSGDAGRELDTAYEQGDRYRLPTDMPRVGLFGNGIPETLIAASGACPIHVSMGRSASPSAINDVIEPFVDEEVRIFLNRLMNGEFSNYRGIVFARDDAPGMIAYQYATEWIRQGRASNVPPLFLWNLVHTDTPAVRRFNAVQAQKLFAFLESVGLSRPDADSIAMAAATEAERADALARMQSRVGTELSGTTALRWRNAGRFMDAGNHARLLSAALANTNQTLQGNLRLGMVGSPLASVATYEMLEKFGTIVCDLQPWGQVWPGSGNVARALDEALAATAADPSCYRLTPSTNHRKAMIEALADARCDLVICQLAQTDDTFGWEMPSLEAALHDRGIAFINLGFRVACPDADWLNGAAQRIQSALEART